MQRIMSLLTVCAVVALAMRQHKLEQDADRLRRNTGDAFAAVARHLERTAIHNNGSR